MNSLLWPTLVMSALQTSPSMPYVQPIKVGVVLPLTGRFSNYGNDCLSGMTLAVTQWNTCSLIVEDNHGDKIKTQESLRKLASQGVSIIVGPLISENATGAAFHVDSVNIPLILPATTHRFVTKLSSLVFRLCYTDEFQIQVMTDFVYFILGKKRPALFVDNSSLYSIELAEILVKELQGIGTPVVATKTYESGESDFRQYLLKIAEANPDCIFLPGYDEHVRLIMDQARELGMHVPLIGWDTWDSHALLDRLGSEGLTSFYCTHFCSKDPNARHFRDAYFSEVGSEPTGFSALGYDAIGLVCQLQLENPEPETAFNKLNKVTDFRGVTGTIDLSNRKDPVKSGVIVKIRGSRLSIEQKITPDK